MEPATATDKKSRKGGCMKWLIVLVVIAAIALFATYRWALANGSVATLDKVDALFNGNDVALAAGPVSFSKDDAGTGEQVLYVYRDKNADPDVKQPVLVWIHGGAWRDGDPKDYAFIARNFAPEGYVVVNLGYRKMEAGKYPAMLEDGASALRWVADNIGEYGGDPSRIYLSGHSAGAYNAAMLALDMQWLGREGLAPDTIDGVIGLAGPYDFLPLDTESTIRTFGDVADPLVTQPVNFVRGDAPPMLLLHGTADTVVKPRNSVSLGTALTEAGGQAEVEQFEGQSHIDILMTIARPFDRDGRTKAAMLPWLAARDKAVQDQAADDAVSAAVQAEGG